MTESPIDRNLSSTDEGPETRISPKEPLGPNGLPSEPSTHSLIDTLDDYETDNLPFHSIENVVNTDILPDDTDTIPNHALLMLQSEQFNYREFSPRFKRRMAQMGLESKEVTEVESQSEDTPVPKTTAYPGATHLMLDTLGSTAAVGIHKHLTSAHMSYMRKSLSMAYKQADLLRTINSTILGVGKVIEEKLDAIKVNTVTPEAKKTSFAQKVSEEYTLLRAKRQAQKQLARRDMLVDKFIGRPVRRILDEVRGGGNATDAFKRGLHIIGDTVGNLTQKLPDGLADKFGGTIGKVTSSIHATADRIGNLTPLNKIANPILKSGFIDSYLPDTPALNGATADDTANSALEKTSSIFDLLKEWKSEYSTSVGKIIENLDELAKKPDCCCDKPADEDDLSTPIPSANRPSHTEARKRVRHRRRNRHKAKSPIKTGIETGAGEVLPQATVPSPIPAVGDAPSEVIPPTAPPVETVAAAEAILEHARENSRERILDAATPTQAAESAYQETLRHADESDDRRRIERQHHINQIMDSVNTGDAPEIPAPKRGVKEFIQDASTRAKPIARSALGAAGRIASSVGSQIRDHAPVAVGLAGAGLSAAASAISNTAQRVQQAVQDRKDQRAHGGTDDTPQGPAADSKGGFFSNIAGHLLDGIVEGAPEALELAAMAKLGTKKPLIERVSPKNQNRVRSLQSRLNQLRRGRRLDIKQGEAIKGMSPGRVIDRMRYRMALGGAKREQMEGLRAQAEQLSSRGGFFRRGGNAMRERIGDISRSTAATYRRFRKGGAITKAAMIGSGLWSGAKLAGRATSTITNTGLGLMGLGPKAAPHLTYSNLRAHGAGRIGSALGHAKGMLLRGGPKALAGLGISLVLPEILNFVGSGISNSNTVQHGGTLAHFAGTSVGGALKGAAGGLAIAPLLSLLGAPLGPVGIAGVGAIVGLIGANMGLIGRTTHDVTSAVKDTASSMMNSLKVGIFGRDTTVDQKGNIISNGKEGLIGTFNRFLFGASAKFDTKGNLVEKSKLGLLGNFENSLRWAFGQKALTADEMWGKKLWDAKTQITPPDGSTVGLSAPLVTGGGYIGNPGATVSAPVWSPDGSNSGGNYKPLGPNDDKRRIEQQPQYQEAFKLLPKEIQERVSKSQVLKFVVWSTDIALGPKITAQAMGENYDTAISDDTYARKVMQERTKKYINDTAEKREDAIKEVGNQQDLISSMERNPKAQVGFGTMVNTVSGASIHPMADASLNSDHEKTHNADGHVPRGIRNNNPGNLNFAHQHLAHLETGVPDPRYAAFPTMDDGIRALRDQLVIYNKRGIRSITDVISKYAPPSENATQSYINTVAKHLGVSPYAQLDLTDPKVQRMLMYAICGVEEGHGFISLPHIDRVLQLNSSGDPISSTGQTGTPTPPAAGDGSAAAAASAIGATGAAAPTSGSSPSTSGGGGATGVDSGAGSVSPPAAAGGGSPIPTPPAPASSAGSGIQSSTGSSSQTQTSGSSTSTNSGTAAAAATNPATPPAPSVVRVDKSHYQNMSDALSPHFDRIVNALAEAQTKAQKASTGNTVIALSQNQTKNEAPTGPRSSNDVNLSKPDQFSI